MNEVWKDIAGYEGYYQVSDLGRVKSMQRTVLCKRFGFQAKRERILSSKPGMNGYVYVTLVKDGINQYKRVHRLVAEAFIANPANKSDVNHKDGVKSNNALPNLEWVTVSENTRHKVDVLGKQIGGDVWNAKIVLDTMTGIFYDTLKQACHAKGEDYKRVSHYLTGKRQGATSLIYA